MEIKCQDRHCGADCLTCNGNKVVLKKAECKSCKTSCWVKPNSHLNIVGVEYYSFDGLKFKVLALDKVICENCNSWEQYQ